jgi:hypothetical protein
LITTVTTATMAASTFTAGVGVAVTLLLIVFIGLRELAAVLGPGARQLARLLVIAIASFIVVFAVTVAKNLAALI